MNWKPDNWDKTVGEIADDLLRQSKLGAYQTAETHIRAGADAMHQADVEWLEKYIFYVDTAGYIALKPDATKNWQTWKGEEEK